MQSILSNLNRTILAGIALLVIMLVILSVSGEYYGNLTRFIFRLLHVASGVMWIGLLWYFNFVQIPNMGRIPDKEKPAITKIIAPSALFWFRWAALATLLTGIILGILNGYFVDAILLGINSKITGHTAIGIGMWLGVIMAYNVWFIIWPNQKKALGIVEATAEEKKKSGRTAMLFSRANTMLSIPMLYAMVSAQTLYQIS